MIGQPGSMSFGTPTHGQSTSSYLPGYLLGGHTPSQVVGVINNDSLSQSGMYCHAHAYLMIETNHRKCIKNLMIKIY